MTAFHAWTDAPRRPSRGYILVEAVVAMALLSSGMIAIQTAMRQGLLVRGIARDYTQARFLLENLVAGLDLQPEHANGTQSGRFEGEYARFSWSWTIERIDLPTPPIPPDVKPEDVKELTVPYIAKVRATISWMRGKQDYEETAETLLAPSRLFVPKEELMRLRGRIG